MIAPIHTVLVYSKPEVYSTVLGKFLGFIAEGPGAQLFMLLMGIYFSFQQRHLFAHIVKRSLLLFVASYILNLLKFVVPTCLHLIPATMLADLQVQNDSSGILQLFFLGDILHFAALALLVLYLVKQLKQFHYWSLLFAMIVCFISPFCWDIYVSNPLLNYLLQLSGGQPPQVFFPLFPWLVYPLLGLSVGYFIKQYGLQVFGWLRNFGIVFLLYGWVLKPFFLNQISPSFYRAYPADTFQHAGIVLITLYVWEGLYTHVTDNYFFRLLQYMSQHITQVYFIQWILIFWLLPVFGYQKLNYNATLIAIALTSTTTITISFLLNLCIKKIKH